MRKLTKAEENKQGLDKVDRARNRAGEQGKKGAQRGERDPNFLGQDIRGLTARLAEVAKAASSNVAAPKLENEVEKP